ncbi:hypothetical protein GC173_08570 [bacterium]|nr:hypothetical protein [bacterium]
MTPAQLADTARGDRHFLDNVLNALPVDAGSAVPLPGMMTAAQQIVHIAATLDWFLEGVFGSGFHDDFSAQQEALARATSIAEARVQLNAAWDRWIAAVENCPESTLQDVLPPNPFFQGKIRETVIMYNSDHTAHHRGILTVYLRHLGITPPMVYM